MRQRTISFVIATLLGVGCVVASRAARAGESAAMQKTAAEALFEEGMRLKRAGQFLESTKKFEQAQRLDPGIGTLLHLAEAYERAGKLASAWGNYKEAAAAAQRERDGRREALGNELAKKLEPKLARLSIELGANKSLPGLVIKRGPVELDASTASVLIPVDAGQLTIVVTARGYMPHDDEITVVDGETRTLTIAPLVPEPPEPKADEPKPQDSKPTLVAPQNSYSMSTGQRALRYGSLVLGIGAAGSAGAAAAFAVRAVSLNDDASAFCDATTCSTIEGEALTHDALLAAKIATTATVIAGVAGAGALGMLIGSLGSDGASEANTAPRTSWTAAPWLDGNSFGATLGGSF